MASFKTLTPTNARELHENLIKLFENKSHVKSIRLDSISQMVQVDLDWAANLKVPDFQIPIKSPALTEAREVLADIESDSQRGHSPTMAQAERLFNCIDTSKH